MYSLIMSCNNKVLPINHIISGFLSSNSVSVFVPTLPLMYPVRARAKNSHVIASYKGPKRPSSPNL